MLLSRLSNPTDTAIVAALWLYEVVNVIRLAARKNRITDQKRENFWRASDLAIEVENPTPIRMFVSVRAFASYLEVAIRHQLPLAALDRALVKAAREASVKLVEL